MKLSRLEIKDFRNLQCVQIEPWEGFNFFHGDNGSGKTSFLEAIYYLGMGGRSFRSQLSRHIISYDSDKCFVFGRLRENEHSEVDTTAGIKRTRDGSCQIRIAGDDGVQIDLAKLLPLQLINSHSYRLLESGPKYRRQFIDWGMFHVEHSFLSCWKKAQRILKQRNAILKQKKVSVNQIRLWDIELESASLILHNFRRQYVELLKPLLSKFLEILLGKNAIITEYYAGWNTDKSLQELLVSHLDRDLRLGYTNVGHQKADLRFKINSVPVHEILSRGQQKLLVYALRLSQGLLLQQETGKRCIYLIDDLPAELDKTHRHKVIDMLSEMNAQTFITGIDLENLEELAGNKSVKMFHVKHGAIWEDGKQ